MYNKYYFLILTSIVTFLIILLINFSYYIKNKNIEKFQDNCPVSDKEFLNTNVKNTCDFICNKMETPQSKTNCVNNCPAFAEKKILKGPSLGMDYLLKTFYKQDLDRDIQLKKNVDTVLTQQAMSNSNFINILGDKCSQEELAKIKDDMNKDTYGNWVKLGNSSNKYSYDGPPAKICTSDKNFININDNYHFKNKDINNIINTHSIIGLSWFRFANINHPAVKNYIQKGTITEITSDYIRSQLINKIEKKQPLTFYKAEIPLFFKETDNITYTNPPKNTIINNLRPTNYIIINNTLYLPHNMNSTDLPVWLYSDKDIIKLREEWNINKINELSKLDNVKDCIYTHNDLDTLDNKITHIIDGKNYQWGKIGITDDNEYSLISDYKTAIQNKSLSENNCIYKTNDLDTLDNKITHIIDGKNYQWGKIGNTDDNEYSLISDYKTAVQNKSLSENNCIYKTNDLDTLDNKITHIIDGKNYQWGKIGITDDNEYSLISDYKTEISNENKKCLIPGNLHADITNLPNELTDPNTQNKYGKYSTLGTDVKYNPANYNLPYIHKSDLDNTINDMCFVKKNSADESKYGKKQKDGGEYGLIGTWGQYLRDTSDVPEKRYGKIKNDNNDGWVGQIGSSNGKYAKIGYTYENPSGLRWVKFVPSISQKTNNPNIIINDTLKGWLKDNKNTHKITKMEFDSLGIQITENSLIQGIDNEWYKPRDIIIFNSFYCDSVNNTLIESVEMDEEEKYSDTLTSLTYKYYSDQKQRFDSKFKDCPSDCNKDSEKTGDCAPCFKNGLITIANNDWSSLVNSINNNTNNLNTLITQCEDNLYYIENGARKSKKTPDQFKTLKFKKINTKPLNGREIKSNNPDFSDHILLPYLMPVIEPITPEEWNSFGINDIGLNDYVKVASPSGPVYFIIDDTSFFNIINDYKREYDTEFGRTKSALPQCSIPYNYVDKTRNTCTTPDQQCVPDDNITLQTYNEYIINATDQTSKWYKELYIEGENAAKQKEGKYWDIPGEEPLGTNNKECVPKTQTQLTEGNKYVPPDTCPPQQNCRLDQCVGCQDTNLECKSDAYKYSKEQLELKQNEKRTQGKGQGKTDFVNTYDGMEKCVPATWLPNEENGKLRVEQGSANACTLPNKCHITDQTGWDTIMADFRSEKAANEKKCTELNDALGTRFKTCLLENTS